MELKQGVFYNSYNIRIKPNIYVIITEDEFGKPRFVQISAGKAGSEVSANAYALSVSISKILENDSGFSDILEMYSSVTSMKLLSNHSGINVRSLPEAIFVAFNRYRDIKFEELKQITGEPYKPPYWAMRE